MASAGTVVRRPDTLVGQCMVCRDLVHADDAARPHDKCACDGKRNPLDVRCWHRACATRAVYFTARKLRHTCPHCDTELEARDASWVPRNRVLRALYFPLLALYVLVPLALLVCGAWAACTARGLLTHPIGRDGLAAACWREAGLARPCAMRGMAWVIVLGMFGGIVAGLAYLGMALCRRVWLRLRPGPATRVTTRSKKRD